MQNNNDYIFRLKEIAKDMGGNRSLCKMAGVSERTFANWISGSSEPKVLGLTNVALAADVTLDWIMTGSEPKKRIASISMMDSSIVQIPLIDAEVQGTGSSSLKVIKHFPFSTDYLKERLGHTHFDQLCVIKICGDSMEPTMSNNDFVLVDQSRTKSIDGLTAFISKDTISIKRINYLPNGIKIVSDNSSLYPAYEIESKEVNSISILGQVLWICKNTI